jgi:hypothetical protein
VAEEKGWWEAEAEASPPEEQDLFRLPEEAKKAEADVEVEVGQMPTVLTVLLVVGMLYLFYRLETSDSIFVQVCFGILFW